MNIIERLISKVDWKSEGSCWDWLGTINEYGYPKISIENHPRRAHRISYEAFIGPIPKGLDLDHLCRNRKCINPKHLEPVTRKENLNRSPITFWRGGQTTAKIKKSRTHCKHGHEWSEENTYIHTYGWRVCRECKKIQERKSYYARKAK